MNAALGELKEQVARLEFLVLDMLQFREHLFLESALLNQEHEIFGTDLESQEKSSLGLNVKDRLLVLCASQLPSLIRVVGAS